MLDVYSALDSRLQARAKGGHLRRLARPDIGVDFQSNDYLGLARSEDFHRLVLADVLATPRLVAGSTGSRLISGQSQEVIDVESFIAEVHGNESALLFPSGYLANLTLFSCLLQKCDTIIVDEYIHRSVHDGCLMSNATKWKFRHNDLDDLEARLKRVKGRCYVAIESLYSMEGDFAPLLEIADLAARYDAALIVDEAHAFGVFGYGLVHRLGLQQQVFATLITYGKAMGGHGAALLCQEAVRSYLINFGSPFIYSTAMPDITWRCIRLGYQFLDSRPDLAMQLQQRIHLLRTQTLRLMAADTSPIQVLPVSGKAHLLRLRAALSARGLQAYAVFAPTVKEGTERLRICVHAFNTAEEIGLLAAGIAEGDN
jgi:8-amino-7-oxononanoate synthase